MIALLWLLYASFGIIYRSFSPLITPILTDFHMSYSQMGFVLGSWQLTYIGAASEVQNPAFKTRAGNLNEL